MTDIGKLLYGKLNKVAPTYPLVAENSTRFPFIIYQTTATRPTDTKDGIYQWVYNTEINIVSDRYDDVVSLCTDAIDRLLELETVLDINISEVSESFSQDAYIRTINIIIKL